MEWHQSVLTSLPMCRTLVVVTLMLIMSVMLLMITALPWRRTNTTLALALLFPQTSKLLDRLSNVHSTRSIGRRFVTYPLWRRGYFFLVKGSTLEASATLMVGVDAEILASVHRPEGAGLGQCFEALTSSLRIIVELSWTSISQPGCCST